MVDSIAERIDAGWQAARHWETECEAARAERDALQAQLAALKKRVADARGDGGWPEQHLRAQLADAIASRNYERNLRESAEHGMAHRRAENESLRDQVDALSAQLAALKKRVADAPRKMLYPRDESEKTKWVAVLALEDGE